MKLSRSEAEFFDGVKKEGPAIEVRASPATSEKKEEALKFQDDFFLEYGELPPENSVFQYVDSIVQEIARKMGIEKIKLVIAPNWLEVNACVFKEGVLAISGGLLEKIEFVEELQGVIGHELHHLKEKHVERIEQKLEKAEDVKDYIRILGISRLQEDDADIRGGVIALDKAGINPLGYKVFLEKMRQPHERGFIHGTNLDRALNIASVAHFFDMSSLSRDLTVLGEEIKKAIKEIKKDVLDYRCIWNPPLFRKETNTEQLKIRDNLIEKMPVEKLSTALQKVKNKLIDLETEPEKNVLKINYLEDAAIRIAKRIKELQIILPKEKIEKTGEEIEKTAQGTKSKLIEEMLDVLPFNEEQRATIEKLVEKIAFTPARQSEQILNAILDFLKNLPTFSAKEIAQTISFMIHKAWTAVQSKKSDGKMLPFSEKSEEICALLPALAIKHLPQFSDWSQSQKDFISLFLVNSVLEETFLFEEKIAEGQTKEEEEFFSREIKKIFKNEKFYRRRITDDELLIFQKIIFDKDYLSEEFGFVLLEIPYSQLPQELLARLIAKRLEGLSLRELLTEADRLTEMGINVDQILEKNPQQAVRLMIEVIDQIRKLPEEEYAKIDIERMAEWVEDPSLRGALKRFTRKQFLPKLSRNEQFELLFLKNRGTIQERDSFIENECSTKDELYHVRKAVEHSIEDFLQEGHLNVFIGQLMDRLSFRFIDVNKFISFLLESRRSDRDLKTFMYEVIRERAREVPPAAIVKSANDTVRTILNLDDIERRVLLRKLLTSEFGALPNSRRRKEFFHILLTKTVSETSEEEDIMKIIRDISESLSETKEWNLIYFAIQGILAERIAQPPMEKAKWNEMYDITEDYANFYGAEEAWRLLEATERAKPTAEMFKKPWKYELELAQIANSRLQNWLEGKEVFLRNPEIEMSPADLAIQIGEKIGAIGVRFLQLLPQFVDIPSKYQNRFNEVYDQVIGQSKLSAVTTLEREWPEMWNEVRAIKKRVGGGSLMTVYEIETSDQKRQVIKVRNPNLIYNVELASDFIRAVLENLILKNRQRYELALATLDDVLDWVKNDVNFKNFLEKDQIFRKKWQGFAPEGFQYHIYIPESYGPANPYFLREEYMDGENLTQWEKLEKQGHNMKEISSLLVRHYLAQLSDGTIHSDIHIGNFRVAPGNRVAILDRNFYLEFDENERMAVQKLLSPALTSGERLEIITSLLENQGVSMNADIKNILATKMANLETGELGAVLNFAIELKKTGVKFPLKIALLLKNLASLHRIASHAGFKNLGEAVLYTPSS